MTHNRRLKWWLWLRKAQSLPHGWFYSSQSFGTSSHASTRGSWAYCLVIVEPVDLLSLSDWGCMPTSPSDQNGTRNFGLRNRIYSDWYIYPCGWDGMKISVLRRRDIDRPRHGPWGPWIRTELFPPCLWAGGRLTVAPCHLRVLRIQVIWVERYTMDVFSYNQTW